MSQKTEKRVLRKYTSDYKQEAVRLSRTRGVSVTARELGIGENLLYKWRTESDAQQKTKI